MKAVIVSYGHSAAGFTLAKYLSSKLDLTFMLVVYGDRHTESILNLDLKGVPYGLIKDRDTVNRLLPKELISYIGNSFDIVILHTFSTKLLRDWKRRNIRCCFSASRYIYENNFDIVHFNGSSGFQLYFHLFLLNKPKVYTIHDYIQHSGEKNWQQLLLNFILTRFNYQFIQHSKKLREEFIKYYKVDPRRTHAIYYSITEIYTIFKKKESNQEPFAVLLWGRISKYKGIRYLIEASVIIKKDIPSLKIIIAGEGNLGFAANRLDKETFEIHNDYIDNEALIEYIQRSSVVVLPYTDATQSGVLMTAYAFNKPVVACSVGGITEMVDDGITGKLVPPRDPAKLAEAIIYLLKNPDARETISRNIKHKFAKGEYCWDTIAEKTIGVYRKALNT